MKVSGFRDLAGFGADLVLDDLRLGASRGLQGSHGLSGWFDSHTLAEGQARLDTMPSFFCFFRCTDGMLGVWLGSIKPPPLRKPSLQRLCGSRSTSRHS